MKALRPFWRHYGGKWKSALRYPAPKCSTIIEPFAGGAGYSLRYHERNVVLVEKHPQIAELWRWLIGSSPADVLALPDRIDHMDEVPSDVPEGGRLLISASLVNATEKTFSRKASSFTSKYRALGSPSGWGIASRARVASQVDAIKHWRIIEGDYSSAPDVTATWFIDPPYQIKGSHYGRGVGKLANARSIDFDALGAWCMSRRGQSIVCENEGATWLPFVRAFVAGSANARTHVEAVWSQETADAT